MRSDGEGNTLVLGGQDRSLRARLMASEAAMEELRLLRQRQETLVEEAKRKLPQELVRPAGCINSSIDKLRNAVDHLKRTDSDLVGALHTLNTQILQLKLAEAQETDGENKLMSASCRSMSSSAVSIPSVTSSRTSTLIDLPDSRRSSGFFDASSPSPPLTPDIATPEKLHHYAEVDGRVSAGWPDVNNHQFYKRHSFGEIGQSESDSVVSNDVKQSYFSGMMPVTNQAPREEKKKEDSLSRRFKLALRPRSKSGLSVCYPYPSPMHAIAIQSDMFVPADSESVVEEEQSSVDITTGDHSQSAPALRPAVVSGPQAGKTDDRFGKAPPDGKGAGLLRPVSTPPDISRAWNDQVPHTAPWAKNSEPATEELVDIPDYENIFSAYSELPGNDIAPRRHSFAGSHAMKKHVEDDIPTYENLSNFDNEYGDYVTLTPEDLPQISQATTTRPASEVHIESPSNSGVKPVAATSEPVSRPEVPQERKAPRKPKPTPRQSLLKKASPAVTPPLPQPRAEPQTDSRDVNVKETPVRETSSNQTTSQENPTSKTTQPGPALLMASLIADGKVQGLTVAAVPSKEKDRSPLTKLVGKYSPRKQESKSSSTTNVEKATLSSSQPRKEQPQPDSNSAKTVRMKFRAPAGVDIRPRSCNDKVENSHVRSTKLSSEPNGNRKERRERTAAPSPANKPHQLMSEGRHSPCRKLQFQHESSRMSSHQAREGQIPPGHYVPHGTEISTKRCSVQASAKRMSKDAPLPQPTATPANVSGRQKCPVPTESRYVQQPVVTRGVATDLRSSVPNTRPERGGVPHGQRYRPHSDCGQQSSSQNPGCVKKEDSNRRYVRHGKPHSDKRARRHTTAVNSPAHPSLMNGLADHRNRHSHSSTSLNGHPVSKFPSNGPHSHRVPHGFARGVRGLKKAGQSRSTSRLYDYDTSVLGSSSDESSSSDSDIRRSDSESDTESSDEGGLILAEAKWPAVVGTATRRRLSSQDSLSRLFPSCHLVTEL
ncbi:uncharacterized protein LOC144913845 isoform X1 [Branchiostoma floridae x Branchiostoma belcheri]